jgi:hypothetical protein
MQNEEAERLACLFILHSSFCILHFEKRPSPRPSPGVPGEGARALLSQCDDAAISTGAWLVGVPSVFLPP